MRAIPSGAELGMPQAEWRPVVGFEKFYRVSNQGAVWSLHRPKNGHSKGLLRQWHDPLGYPMVSLSRGGKVRKSRVHRLVMEAFDGPAPEGTETNHRNGVKSDNRRENLERVSHSGNMFHAYATGLRLPVRGEANPRCKITLGKARRLLRLKGTGTCGEVSRREGVSYWTLYDIWRGHSWSWVAGVPRGHVRVIPPGGAS